MTTTALDMSVLRSARRYGALSIGARMLLSQSAEMAAMSRSDFSNMCAAARRDNAHKGVEHFTASIADAMSGRVIRRVAEFKSPDCLVAVWYYNQTENHITVKTTMPLEFDKGALERKAAETLCGLVKDFEKRRPETLTGHCGDTWTVTGIACRIADHVDKPETIAALVAILPAFLFENA